MSNLSELHEAVKSSQDFDNGAVPYVFLKIMGRVESLCILIEHPNLNLATRNSMCSVLSELLVGACMLYACARTMPADPDIGEMQYQLGLGALELASLALRAAPGISDGSESASTEFAKALLHEIAAVAVDNGFTFEQIVEIAIGKVRAN